MSEQIDIVTLIENNPVTKLSKDYNVKLLVKIKEQFTNFEQKLFLSSFYCYLNCDTTKDFVIDLDNIWNWIGFGQKVNAKRVLEKNFTLDKDYKLSLCQLAKQTKPIKGGHNKETFFVIFNWLYWYTIIICYYRKKQQYYIFALFRLLGIIACVWVCLHLLNWFTKKR